MVKLRNVLVATDFGDASDAALLCGREIARSFGATLHVLHIVDDVFARGSEAEPLEMWAEQQRKLEHIALDSLHQRIRPDDLRKHDERAVTRPSTVRIVC